MTFLQIRQRIAELMGLDSSDVTPDNNATIQDKLKAWVNARYKSLCARRAWNWLIKDFTLQTVTEVTTGTVTATQGSTTITFSVGPTLSAAGWFIKFSSASDWYEIDTHTAASTTAVLKVPYLYTTSSTLTYNLRKVYYALPSDISRIYDIRQTVQRNKLKYLSQREIDTYVPDRTRYGSPSYYSIAGLDSNNQFKAEFYPVPNTALNLNGRYYKIVSDLSADTDTPLIPEAYHEILVWEVLGTYGYLFLDDTRVSFAKAEANNLYQQMVRSDIDTENVASRQPFDVDFSTKDWMLRRLDLPIQ